MNTIQQKVFALSDPVLEQMIKDLEQFENEGFIGECTLRTKAEEVCAKFDSPHVAIWMNQLAFESYRALYHRRMADLAAARALLREANKWIGRDCTSVREQIAELAPLCNRIDAALQEQK